jgi:hypothetical protein
MHTYLTHFFSGEVDPTWPHAILLAITVLASFAVAAGIIFESPKYPASVHRVATWCVIVGVGIEAICTITLFVFDEGISGKQQEKIIALETKLAPRSLSDSEVAELAKILEPFSGQEFTIASYGGEPAQLWARIRGILEKARWKWFDPEMQILLLPGTVGIQVWEYRDGTAREAAQTLVGALKAKDIDAMLLPAETTNAHPDSKIEMLIGSKY